MCSVPKRTANNNLYLLQKCSASVFTLKIVKKSCEETYCFAKKRNFVQLSERVANGDAKFTFSPTWVCLRSNNVHFLQKQFPLIFVRMFLVKMSAIRIFRFHAKLISLFVERKWKGSDPSRFAKNVALRDLYYFGFSFGDLVFTEISNRALIQRRKQ